MGAIHPGIQITSLGHSEMLTFLVLFSNVSFTTLDIIDVVPQWRTFYLVFNNLKALAITEGIKNALVASERDFFLLAQLLIFHDEREK